MNINDNCDDWRDMLHGLGIDVVGGTEFLAAAALIVGLIKKGVFSKENMKKAADFLVQHYDKHPKVMSSVGLIIGCLLLLDSVNDYKEVQRLRDEIISALTYPPEHWQCRFTEIRRQIEALKTRQTTMGLLKAVAAMVFGFIAFRSSASAATRAVLAGGACASGGAAIINCINYYNLNGLIEQLRQDGHLY